MQYYCPKCQIAFDGSICPSCGSRKTREAEDSDLCFLIEKGQIWADMLADVLRQNDIPCICKGRLGAGLTMQVGAFLETQRVFVAYEDLEKAREIAQGLFDEPSEIRETE